MSTDDDGARRAIEDAERRLYDAMVRDDLPAIGRLLADGASYVHSNGVEETGAEYLAAMERGLYTYDRVASSDVTLTVRGDTAIGVGRTLMSVGPRGGAKAVVDLLTTLVWVRDGGDWRLLRRHATRLP